MPPAAIGAIRNFVVVRPRCIRWADRSHRRVGLRRARGNDQLRLLDPFGATRLPLDPQSVAVWAQQNVGPYYDTMSGPAATSRRSSRLGHIPLATTDGTDECLAKAQSMSGRPFTNVLATDDSPRRDGFAGPGLIYDNDR